MANSCTLGEPKRRHTHVQEVRMQILNPGPQRAPYGLCALAMVARAADGGFAQAHRAVLDTAQTMLLGTNIDVASLDEITPAELAKRFEGQPDLARQIVRAMVLMSLASGPTTQPQIGLIKAFASALGVEEPAVRSMQYLAERDLIVFRLDVYRRGNFGDYLDNQYKAHGGLLGVAKGLLGFAGMVTDERLAARYHALGDLPSETLGKHFHRFHVENGFALPGEKGGFPEGGLFHDFGHVLAGYAPTPEGEMLAASFQAGYRQVKDAFYTLLFSVVMHSAGIEMTPFPQVTRLGRIGEGEQAEQMFIALQRGAAMNTDLGNNWNHWTWVEKPIDEVRRMLGIPPLSRPLLVGGWS
jgi:hypothetical protein